MDMKQIIKYPLGVYRYGGRLARFKINLVFKESLGGAEFTEALSLGEGELQTIRESFTSITVDWQQKIYSISEIEEYSRTDVDVNKRKDNFIHEKFYEETTRLKAQIQRDGGIGDRFRIFTLTDFDPKISTIYDDLSEESQLLGREKDKLFIRRMVIMLECLQSESGTLPHSRVHEFKSAPLCLIEVNTKKKIIIFRPDLNETGGLLGKAYKALFEWGFSKSVDYFINCSNMKRLDTPRQRIRSNLFDRIKRILKDPYFITMRPQLIPLLPPDEVSVSFRIQLVSVDSFTGNNCYLEYCITIPEDWTLTSPAHAKGLEPGGNVIYGRTAKCFPNHNEDINFSHQIELQLRYQERKDGHANGTDDRETVKWPILYIQVVSIDWWGSERSEGYIHSSLPTEPGHTDIRVVATKCVPTKIRDKLEYYFLGGLFHMPMSSIGIDPKELALWKSGYESVRSVGVNLKLDTIFQSNKILDKENCKICYEDSKYDDFDVSSSIWDVLQAFESARQKMTAVRDQVLDYLAGLGAKPKQMIFT